MWEVFFYDLILFYSFGCENLGPFQFWPANVQWEKEQQTEIIGMHRDFFTWFTSFRSFSVRCLICSHICTQHVAKPMSSATQRNKKNSNLKRPEIGDAWFRLKCWCVFAWFVCRFCESFLFTMVLSLQIRSKCFHVSGHFGLAHCASISRLFSSSAPSHFHSVWFYLHIRSICIQNKHTWTLRNYSNVFWPEKTACNTKNLQITKPKIYPNIWFASTEIAIS